MANDHVVGGTHGERREEREKRREDMQKNRDKECCLKAEGLGSSYRPFSSLIHVNHDAHFLPFGIYN